MVTSGQVKNIIERFKLTKTSSDERSSADEDIHVSTIETEAERLIPMLNNELGSFVMPFKTREYQKQGIAYMLAAKRSINASAPGTGKTLMAILAVELKNLFPCVVVVPASVKYNWERQWKLVNPLREVAIINDKKSDFTAEVLIMTYDSVGKKEIYEKDGEQKERVIYKYEQLDKIFPDSVIMDESHMIKNAKTIRTKAMKKLCKGVEHIFMLTGTPVLNRPSELISPLTILRQFDVTFGNWRDFVYRYCGAHITRYGLDYTGATNVLELHKRLRGSCYYRVEKRDALKDLPPIQETMYDIDITNRKEYMMAASDLVNYIRQSKGDAQAEKAMYAEALVMINTLSQLSAKGKLEGICEWLDNFIESSDEKLIVFGIHVEMLKLLAEKYRCDFIIGEVSHKRRQQLVDKFQSDGNRILFMNIAVGSVGIDGLQNCSSQMMFCELPWRYEDISQAISRLERSGQQSSVEVHFMLGRETIDQQIWEMLMHKRTITEGVNKGNDFDSQKYMSDMLRKIACNVDSL
jgi:SWI/SNF-related matrix-associated actin-dependent regulator 1 of chromatin subfamily A